MLNDHPHNHPPTPPRPHRTSLPQPPTSLERPRGSMDWEGEEMTPPKFAFAYRMASARKAFKYPPFVDQRWWGDGLEVRKVVGTGAILERDGELYLFPITNPRKVCPNCSQEFREPPKSATPSKLTE